MADGGSQSRTSRTSRTPVLLLKTKSSPSDAYHDLFSSDQDGFAFEPIFVPVLEHRFRSEEMSTVADLLRLGKISCAPGSVYGGMIFTSQRAVEAFAGLVQDGSADADWRKSLGEIPIYSVGPATTRSLEAVMHEPSLQVFGGHTGNGETLAPYIMKHYSEWYKSRSPKPPLLFMVGEQRRDIIPKTLMSESMAAEERIRVDEVVIYGTGVMGSFEEDFSRVLESTGDRTTRWVVVFSPTGCDGMVQRLALLDAAVSSRSGSGTARHTRTLVAAIGPTTRKHLQSFGFSPEVEAEQPSPEGVWKGITRYMAGLHE